MEWEPCPGPSVCEYSKPATMEAFENFLKKASEEVAKWPEWIRHNFRVPESKIEQKRPLPPEILADVLQDKVHIDPPGCNCVNGCKSADCDNL
jgi:hypothetical protein